MPFCTLRSSASEVCNRPNVNMFDTIFFKIFSWNRPIGNYPILLPSALLFNRTFFMLHWKLMNCWVNIFLKLCALSGRTVFYCYMPECLSGMSFNAFLNYCDKLPVASNCRYHLHFPTAISKQVKLLLLLLKTPFIYMSLLIFFVLIYVAYIIISYWCFKGKISCSSIFDTVSLRIPTRSIRNYSTFTVNRDFKVSPSARCVSAANEVCSSTDIFNKDCISHADISQLF
jgi:hypothetical protein